MNFKKPSNKFLISSFAIILGFTFLMYYALQRDPNLILSQLVNKPAPTFSSPLAQGGTFALPTKSAQWKIINFWSTSCIVCRVEAPELEKLYTNTLYQESLKGKIQFVSVNIQDSVDAVLNYAHDLKLSYPIVMDESGRISLDYGVTGTPETFLIDPQGVVRHRIAGEIESERILRFIDWLNQNPSLSAEQALKGYLGIHNEG